MKHSMILEKIHQIFVDEWVGAIHYDARYEVNDKEPFVALSYTPKKTEKRFLTPGDGGYNFTGDLRITVFDKSPSENLDKLDEVIIFLKDKVKNELKFTELEGLGGPERLENGSLFISFVDFSVCYIH